MRQMTKKLMSDIQEAESKIGELKAKLRIAESKEKMQQLTDALQWPLQMCGSSPTPFNDRCKCAAALRRPSKCRRKMQELTDARRNAAAKCRSSSTPVEMLSQIAGAH